MKKDDVGEGKNEGENMGRGVQLCRSAEFHMLKGPGWNSSKQT